MEAMKTLHSSYFCRLCGEENKNGTYLFSKNDNSEELSLLINRYLPIKVENDGKFPTTICPGCNIQLEATKSFMDLIIEGQTKLKELFQAQQQTLQREEKQRQKLEQVLHTVNPNSSVETYTIQSDETGEKFLIQIFSDGPLFPPNHELSLKAEGLEKPKRKRGRPPKQVSEAEKAEEQTSVSNKVEEEAPPDEEDEVDSDGRKRRKIKAPSRYQGIVEGKELDKIFKEEGVIDEEEVEVTETIKTDKDFEEIIGRTETESGEDLGEPVYVTKYPRKFQAKPGRYFIKRRNKRKFVCEVCKKEFFHLGRFELHLKSHKCIYVCQSDNCNFEHEQKEILQRHQEETGHTGLFVIEKVVSADGILRFPEGAEEAAPNTPLVKEEPESTFKCDPCDRLFSCKQNLDVHNRAVHNQERPFICEVCNKGFSYANSLKIHMLTHDRDKKQYNARNYPCNTCGKVLNHPSSLVYHKEKEHSNGKRFVCNKCNKIFKHRQLLQRHQLVHSDERPHRCRLCGASFKTQANLLNHETVHSGEKKFKCGQCSQKFAHRTSLTLHLRWHEGQKPFSCDICHKKFSQKGNLAEHRRIHTGEKPYCCDHCGRSFTTSSQFNLHRKRHTGERPWTCEYCSKSFLHRDSFKTHVRRHFNDRPYKCANCPKAFSECWALKRHERIHSGVKPYTCEVCGKTFADCSNKSKHMRIHYILGNGKLSSDNDFKDFNKQPVFDMKQTSLLQILNPPLNLEKDKTVMETPNLQLTQLVDQQGNPISITTQDGQTVPVVTGSSDDNDLQGLLPDGTLVPIQITTVPEKDIPQEVVEADSSNGVVLNPGIENGINILAGEGEMIKEVDDSQKLDTTNIQFITGEDGQEVCLVTYSVEESGSINPELGIDTFLIQNIK